MNLLLVEDDPNALELASYILRADGHQVTAAGSAAEVFRLDAGRYDLIVVDLGLPDTDGVELIRSLRARHGVRAPILVCSAFVGDRHQREAHEAGCDAFLAKPFRRQQLLAAVEVARRASLERP